MSKAEIQTQNDNNLSSKRTGRCNMSGTEKKE